MSRRLRSLNVVRSGTKDDGEDCVLTDVNRVDVFVVESVGRMRMRRSGKIAMSCLGEKAWHEAQVAGVGDRFEVSKTPCSLSEISLAIVYAGRGPQHEQRARKDKVLTTYLANAKVKGRAWVRAR